jgi:hypothetical protein
MTGSNKMSRPLAVPIRYDDPVGPGDAVGHLEGSPTLAPHAKPGEADMVRRTRHAELPRAERLIHNARRPRLLVSKAQTHAAPVTGDSASRERSAAIRS